MANKRKAEVILYQCNVCDCEPFPSTPAHIARHTSGKKHKKFEMLVEKKNILDAWGIELVDGLKTKYMCKTCDLELEKSFGKMQKHFELVHDLPPQTVSSPSLPKLEVMKVYKRRKFYEDEYDFESDKVNFLLLNGSISIQESNGVSRNHIGVLYKEVIPEVDSGELYRIASELEERGKGTKRGKRVGGSKMVMFGMYWNFQLGWFTHEDPELYTLSEIFIKKMNAYFEIAFPEVMTNFYKILLNEGLVGDDGRFGDTPFTCFAITRDYECLPHDDSTDYGFGIIVWLHPNGEVKIDEQPSFWLPQYKVRFECGNRTTFIMNGNVTVHCTTSPKPTGILGMAFVQKRPFIVELSKALKTPDSKSAERYFSAKKRYNTLRDANKGNGPSTIGD